MKTSLQNIQKVNVTNRILWLSISLFLIVLFQSCVSTVYVPNRSTTVVTREVVPPPWAPQYDNVEQVHYYYLPDVELYYDVWNHQYVYLNEGNWIYTTAYPSQYSNYDINTAYVVVLDAKVNEPWRHHDQYVSHYPRYYYRSVYEEDGRQRNNRQNDHRDYRTNNNSSSYNGNVRGFNENVKTPIYRNGAPPDNQSSRRYTRPNSNNNSNPTVNEQRTQPERRNDSRREEGRTTNTQNSTQPVNQNRQSRRETSKDNDNVSTPVRRTDNNQHTTDPERRTETQQTPEKRTETQQTPQRTQPVVYPSKEVGQPVRVRRDMQQPREEKKQTEQKRTPPKDDAKSKEEDTGSKRRR